MMSRIRCSCGRIYDPLKHTNCPDCGAESAVESVVVAEKVKPPASPEVTETAKTKPSGRPPVEFRQVLQSVPWPVYAVAAVLILFLLIIALRHHGPAVADSGAGAGRGSASPEQKTSPAPSAAETTPPQITPPGGATVPPGGTVLGNISELVAGAGQDGTVKLRSGVYQGGATITRPVHIVADAQAGGPVFIQSDTKDALSIHSKGVVLQNVQIMFTGTGEVPAMSVSDGGEVEMDGCKITSSSTYGAVVNGGASIKATASTFSASNGTAFQIDRQSRGNFTKCTFSDAQTGLNVVNGSGAELHSCAFERNGARNGRGAIANIAGDKTNVTIDDCRFSSNPSGIALSDAASLNVTNSQFKDNGVSSIQGNWVMGLIQIKSSAVAKLDNDTFENDAQGILAANGGNVEITKCRFDSVGLQTRGQLIPTCMAISGNGQGTVLTVRNSTINGQSSYAVGVVSSARINLEETEIAGARTVGLLVGDRSGTPATAEAKHCRFLRNTTGIGVCAGSSARIIDSDCRENSEGVLVLDRGSRLTLNKARLIGNRDHGLCVYGGGEAEAVDSQIENNARGAQSGMQKKSSMSGTLTLRNCRVAGNQTFGVGACAKSQLVLADVTFDGNAKTNIYRETGAIVRMEGAAGQVSADTSPQEATGDEQGSKRARKQRRQSDDDARRIIRRIFRQ